MVYIKKWPQFQSQCLELYQKAPDKTRYLIKATPSQTWLVLKVTDDVTCFKFKTRSSIILNRFESFTKDMTASMAGIPLPSALAASTGATAAEDVEMKNGDNSAATISTAGKGAAGSASAATGGGAGANKKKKKKGGKK